MQRKLILDLQAWLAAWALVPALSLALPAAETKAGLASAAPTARIVRVFDDPATGQRWRLELDPERPGGPGKLVVATGPMEIGTKGGQTRKRKTLTLSLPPVIREGEHLLVTQESAVIDARLDAVALQSAPLGATFKVRLKFSGKVAMAVALGHGRARLAPAAGVWQ